MSPLRFQILLVDDDEDHAEMTLHHLSRVQSAILETRWVRRLSEAMQRLQGDEIDIVLLDLYLVESRGLETLRRVLETETSAAVVILSALEDQDLAVAAVKEGADDFLVKSQLSTDLLERAIRYAVQRKESRLHLLQYATQLERSNEDLKAFALMASHDLQAPLRNILSYCQLLRQRYGDKLDAEGLEFIDFAIGATDRMKMLVKDLLDYLRLGCEATAFAAIDANDAFTVAVHNLAATIAENDVVVNCQALPTVMADHSRLVHLFQNLIDNAIKYRAGERPRIDVSAQPRDGDWQFAVRDNGVGIPAKFHQQIFETFRRLHTQEEQPGSGIGLAICKKVIQSLGGRIWVESDSGKGSTFYFTLQAPRVVASSPEALALKR